MKKIIFVINNLEVGGIQTSLCNLLNEIHDMYDITVLSIAEKPQYAKRLPQNVKMISLQYPLRHLGMSSKDVKGTIRYFTRAFWVLLIRLLGRSNVMKLMHLGQRTIKGYDCAISFVHEGPQNVAYSGCNEIVLDKIAAPVKYTWLHCDYVLSGAHNRKSAQIYSRFDRIIACSEGVRRMFVQCLPQLAEKTVTIRNCNHYERIRALAANPVQYRNGFFHILTVARLSSGKGIDRAIEAVRNCIKNGHKIQYHIVGDGDYAAVLKEKVREYSLEDSVCFYGNQENPYPYMVNADLFLLPSYHEAAPMVFDEAAFLGLPVLATKTTSTDEMIIERGSGWVCENTQEGLTEALLALVASRECLEQVREHLGKQAFSNASDVKEFQKLLQLGMNTKQEPEGK